MTARRHKSKHKLLVIVPWLEDGGADRLLVDILGGLVKKYSISVVTTVESKHPLLPLLKQITHDIYHFDKYSNKKFNDEIKKLITKLEPKCVLSSASQYFYKSVAKVKKSNPSLKIIDILHNSLRPGHINNAIKNTDYIDKHIVVSQHIRNDLLNEGVKKRKIVFIPNGVPVYKHVALLKNNQKNKLQTNLHAGACLKILFVGRASIEKRPLLFLDVCKYLQQKTNLSAICISAGPLKNQLRQYLKKLKLQKYVSILPFMQRYKLTKYYRTADLLINTSSTEGMPLTALEAMAWGCPVVGFSIGGLRQLIKNGKNGFLVKKENAIAMSKKILKIQNKRRLLKELKRNTKLYFQNSKYSLQDMIFQYIKVINS